MGFLDYFIPATSPIPGHNQSQFGKDFTNVVNAGASAVGGLVNQGLYNFGNFVSGGKFSKNQQKTPKPTPAVQMNPWKTPGPTPKPNAKNQAISAVSNQITPTPSPRPTAPAPSFNPQNVLGAATQAIISKLARPTATPTPTAVPTATPTPVDQKRQMMIDTIQEFYKHYGSPPAATLAATMVDESQKYPILQQHPEYLPITSMLESSGLKPGQHISETVTGRDKNGKKVVYYPNNENRQFNGWGWGFPFDSWSPTSPEDVISHVASGVGQRLPYYEKFRQTGNIQDLARAYSGYDAETNPFGGDVYAKNYNRFWDIYKAAEAEIKRRRGIK